MRNIVFAIIFLAGIVAGTNVGGNKDDMPPMNIVVQASEKDLTQYEITWDGERQTDTSLLLPQFGARIDGMMEELGPGWGVWETKRGLAYQVELMRSGKSPRADSKHLVGLAVDVICYDADGKVSWDCDWHTYGKACRMRGFLWGGDFENEDWTHCEYPPLQPL